MFKQNNPRCTAILGFLSPPQASSPCRGNRSDRPGRKHMFIRREGARVLIFEFSGLLGLALARAGPPFFLAHPHGLVVVLGLAVEDLVVTSIVVVGSLVLMIVERKESSTNGRTLVTALSRPLNYGLLTPSSSLLCLRSRGRRFNCSCRSSSCTENDAVQAEQHEKE